MVVNTKRHISVHRCHEMLSGTSNSPIQGLKSPGPSTVTVRERVWDSETHSSVSARRVLSSASLYQRTRDCVSSQDVRL